MKKITALFLVLCMLGTALIACADSTDKDTEDTGNAVASESEKVEDVTDSAASEDGYIADGLPENNYDGKTYTIATMDNPELYFLHEETTGEPITDATYAQITNVEERYNVAIEAAILGTDIAVNTALVQSASAGDNAYQITINHNLILPNLVAQNMLVDLNELTYIDFEKPWWNTDYRDKLTINGKTYFGFGDLFVEAAFYNVHILYVNKDICDQYQVAYPYQAVYDGTWTMEYMQTMMQGVKDDLNGDSVYDFNDQWGLVQSPIQSSILFYTSGFEIMSFDEDGYPYLDMYSDKFVKFYEDLYKFDFETDDVWTDRDENRNFQMFVNGQAMFSSHFLNATATLRAVDFEVGILPYPKYEESSDYINWPTGGNYLMGIPSSVAVADYDFVGIITEALACQGYNYVRPAVFEQTLQGKLARDQESIDMLNLLFDTMTIDFGWIHNGDNGMGWFCNKLLESNVNTPASLYERFAKRAEKHYESVVDAYRLAD